MRTGEKGHGVDDVWMHGLGCSRILAVGIEVVRGGELSSGQDTDCPSIAVSSVKLAGACTL